MEICSHLATLVFRYFCRHQKKKAGNDGDENGADDDEAELLLLLLINLFHQVSFQSTHKTIFFFEHIFI